MLNKSDPPISVQDLVIPPSELERHCGLEVTEQFIGGLWFGVIRRSCWRSLRSRLTLVGTEVIVLALLMMFSIPVGIAAARSSPLPTLSMRRFGGGILAATGVLYGGRLLWRNRQQRSLHRLQQLIEEVEHFNHVAESVTLLDRLHGLTPNASSVLTENPDLLGILQVTRDHLVLGLKLDQQIRQHRNHLLSHPDLLGQLAVQIASLQSLQQQPESQEYGQLLTQLIQISRSVEQELKQERSG